MEMNSYLKWWLKIYTRVAVGHEWYEISSNQLFSNLSLCETIAFTKFLWKKCERKFLQFPHCIVEYWNWILEYFY